MYSRAPNFQELWKYRMSHRMGQLLNLISPPKINISKPRFKSYDPWDMTNWPAISLIFDKCSILKQTIWPWNHTSHTKVYFNEFVANVLRGNIGIVNFDLWGHGGCWRPKTPLGGQKWHEGVNLLKKVFNQSFSTTS